MIYDCTKKDSIPKDKWAIKKGLQMYNESSKEDKDTDQDKKTVRWSGVQRGFQGLQQKKFCLLQDNKDTSINDDTLLLDTGSTFSSIKNGNLITGVRPAERPIEMLTNAGTRIINKTGKMLGLGRNIWYDLDSVANIFGFSDVTDEYRVTYDNAIEDAFHVHTDKNEVVKFK